MGGGDHEVYTPGVKGVISKQIRLTLIEVNLSTSMQLMQPNQGHITTVYMCVCVCVLSLFTSSNRHTYVLDRHLHAFQ